MRPEHRPWALLFLVDGEAVMPGQTEYHWTRLAATRRQQQLGRRRLDGEGRILWTSRVVMTRPARRALAAAVLLVVLARRQRSHRQVV